MTKVKSWKELNLREKIGQTDFARSPSFLYRIAAFAAIYGVLTENISSMIFKKMVESYENSLKTNG
jgi:hypothetical protein